MQRQLSWLGIRDVTPLQSDQGCRPPVGPMLLHELARAVSQEYDSLRNLDMLMQGGGA